MSELKINASSIRIEDMDGLSGSVNVLPPPNGSHVSLQTPQAGGIIPLSITINGGAKIYADALGNLPLVVLGRATNYSGTPAYANNVQALANGLEPGEVYHTNGVLKIVV